MTIEEVKNLFYNYKNANRKLKCLRQRLTELREDMSAIKSSMGGSGMPNGKGENNPKIERMLDKVLEVEKRYLDSIDEYMQAEDRLSDAFTLADLTEEERDVLIDSYLNFKPAWKTALDMGWSERTIKYRKKSAINKLSKN